jgi:D-glycero-alpha-D-manno-heptose-7-phosphate kinase
MIITKAPMRISFAGGGTDLKAFYANEPGSVVSTAIDKFVYIAVHKYFYNKILLKYSKTEHVDDVSQIQNERFRECLKLLDIKTGIEITSIADIPAQTGVGSSSSFTVALSHALHTYKGEHVSAGVLAKEACEVEINLVGSPIGKQDQYASAYGGLNYITFNPDETVRVEPLVCKKETLTKLNQSLLMFYTGITRSADDLLSEQRSKTAEKMDTLRQMKKFSEQIKDDLTKGDLDSFADALHRAWLEKSKVTSRISNDKIDEYYRIALEAGAKGGKLLGAGGGGFLLFYCEKDKQPALRTALKGLRELEFNLEPQGSRIVYMGD